MAFPWRKERPHTAGLRERSGTTQQSGTKSQGRWGRRVGKPTQEAMGRGRRLKTKTKNQGRGEVEVCF